MVNILLAMQLVTDWIPEISISGPKLGKVEQNFSSFLAKLIGILDDFQSSSVPSNMAKI